jgi:hypothetical protein
MPAVPVITPFSPPVIIEPIGANKLVTYQGFLNSLTSTTYKVNTVRKQTNNTNQLNEPISVVTVDSGNGNKSNFTKTSILSDYQPNAYTIEDDWAEDAIFFDTNTYLDFTVLPNTALQFYMVADKIYNYQAFDAPQQPTYIQSNVQKTQLATAKTTPTTNNTKAIGMFVFAAGIMVVILAITNVIKPTNA